MMIRLRTISCFFGAIVAAFLTIAISGCVEKNINFVSSYKDSTSESISQKVVRQYADIVLRSYQDSLQLNIELQKNIQAFINAPSAQTHISVKHAWLAARQVYGQTEVYRFYGGPIDDERGLEAKINAWPVDEAYLDYVRSFDGQDILMNGLINQPGQAITVTEIVEANERDGEKNISMGFHAIEFLLWGQDLSTDSAGQRQYQDYISTSLHATRRARYLALLSDLLVEYTQQLIDDWLPGDINKYREKFINDPNTINNILTGMHVLAGNELAGERIEVALETFDQEDEHSCFSDNTHVDIAMNIQGIINVYQGRYKAQNGDWIEGYGLRDWLQQYSVVENQRINNSLQQSMGLAKKIEPPFDQAILNNQQRENIQALVYQLRLFSRLIKTALQQSQVNANE